MTRMSKQEKRRHVYKKKKHYPAEKTGSLKDNLSLGYKEHTNALAEKANTSVFIGKVK
ncbi:MAG: hypothetical protein S4CHLAM37_08090 [Chlamydiia bacterium]|nr:hypothetical protein [Chlamydiia bacterium]